MDRLRARRSLKKTGKKIRSVLILCAAFFPTIACADKNPPIELIRDDRAGELRVLVGGREAVTYRYSETLDLPHYWPMRSPSGKNMLVEQAEPYPHHRSFWFADTVRLEGEDRDLSTYNALYSGLKNDAGVYGPPFRDRVRHAGFSKVAAKGSRAEISADLVWEMDGTRPVLRERRRLVIHSLGAGEYLLDVEWTLTAAQGDVLFKSDDVHYAWPYLRLDPQFSGDKGAVITSDTGTVGEKATNLRFARWMDYSNTVDGTPEGVSVFQWPDGQEHRWLTREYGTFGPRRPDDKSGKPFMLRKGESITQRIGVLVHAGNVGSGRVGERYKLFIEGEWK